MNEHAPGGSIRDAARTRRAVLNAARVALVQHGSKVSMATVAGAAGVSKGGLLHHFGSKEELLLAVVQDLYEGFETSVEDKLHEEQPGPGALARAYVRTCFDDLRGSSEFMLEHTAVLNLLHTVDSVIAYADEQNLRWQERLRDDSLDADVAQLVVLVTDGLASRSLWSRPHSTQELDALEAQLLGLIDHHQDLAALLRSAAPDA